MQILAWSLGGQEMFFILLIVLLLFGAKKLPELARGLGSSVREFKKAKDEFDDELRKTTNDLKVEESVGKRPVHTTPASLTAPAEPRVSVSQADESKA